jgi:hypothetical protein
MMKQMGLLFSGVLIAGYAIMGLLIGLPTVL